MIKASNIEQNLNCADLRYSPRLTIRYCSGLSTKKLSTVETPQIQIQD
jgi:hypothetical protein